MRQNYAGYRSGLFQSAQAQPGPFADLLSREMIASPEDGDEIIGLLCQTKELLAQPLLHFSRSLVREGQGHNLRDGQGAWFSEKKVEDAIDKNRGLAGPGSRHHHDIAVPGCLCQEPALGVRECQEITHR